MKKSDTIRKTPVAVSLFFETGRETLQLELGCGEAGLQRLIQEGAINRPGLALSGFYQYFAHRRIQVMGFAEHAYLSSLETGEQRSKLQEFFKKKIPCIVLSRGKRILPAIRELATEARVPVLRTPMITKDFVNAATILMENLMAPRLTRQGTMVEIMGRGVLIAGKAGMGKSETALGLIKRGHALVSDDVTSLRLDSAGHLIGSPIGVTRYHMEIRGLGIIHVPSLFGVASVRGEKKLDLVITLVEPGPRRDLDSEGNTQGTIDLLGVPVPHLRIPVAPGRDPVNVVETAALDQKLRALGHDAAKELDEQLVAQMTQGKVGSE